MGRGRYSLPKVVVDTINVDTSIWHRLCLGRGLGVPNSKKELKDLRSIPGVELPPPPPALP